MQTWSLNSITAELTNTLALKSKNCYENMKVESFFTPTLGWIWQSNPKQESCIPRTWKKYILTVIEIVFIEIKFVIFYHFLLNQSLFIEEGCYNLPWSDVWIVVITDVIFSSITPSVGGHDSDRTAVGRELVGLSLVDGQQIKSQIKEEHKEHQREACYDDSGHIQRLDGTHRVNGERLYACLDLVEKSACFVCCGHLGEEKYKLKQPFWLFKRNKKGINHRSYFFHKIHVFVAFRNVLWS